MDEFRRLGFFHDIDLHFADYVCSLQGVADETLWLAALLTSFFTNLQHTAFDCRGWEGKMFSELLDSVCPEVLAGWTVPDLATVKGFTRVVGGAGELKPLIFDNGLLYLHKFWKYECKVASFIQFRCQSRPGSLNELAASFSQLFPENVVAGAPNWQKVAAAVAVSTDFAVISGGPGTGKTTTVGKVLALLLKQDPNLNVRLVAPTGKAADRLSESIRKFKSLCNSNVAGGYQFDQTVIDSIPEETSTIHRFLKYNPSNGGFVHGSKNQVVADLLLVDEASMVSLPLFASLFAALPDNCRVILLGDKDQLAAVENGNVLGDITAAEHINRFSQSFALCLQQLSGGELDVPVVDDAVALDDSVVQLEHSWRFDATSGIGALSDLVNRCGESGSIDEFKSVIEHFGDVSFSQLCGKNAVPALMDELKNGPLQDYFNAVKLGDPEKVLAALGRFRVLCAVNAGPYGVGSVNQLLEQTLFPGNGCNRFYHGRPIMITANDYRLNLMNGDVGVILQDGNGILKAYFPGELAGSVRDGVNPTYLCEHITAFAITIHKSQGSEFERVLMLLPEKDSRILTKELIYTGITRAKKQCDIHGSLDLLVSSSARRTKRVSGLCRRLES